MYNCKVCGHHINLDEDGKGYCPICDKEIIERKRNQQQKKGE